MHLKKLVNFDLLITFSQRFSKITGLNIKTLSKMIQKGFHLRVNIGDNASLVCVKIHENENCTLANFYVCNIKKKDIMITLGKIRLA